MGPRIPPAVERAHVATQRRLLDVERDSSERLAAAAARAARSVPGRSPAAIVAASKAIRSAVADEALRIRADARAAGRSTLTHELRVGGQEADRPELSRITLTAPTTTLADQVAAQRVGDDYAAAWLARASSDGPEVATASMRYRAVSAGGAEAGQAFGQEREATTVQLARAHGGEVLARGAIIKLWNARLDACPRCHSLDGSIRPIGLQFRDGKIPGSVHKRCRCIGGIVVLPVVTARDEAA